jgi:hypothetical protein
MERRPPGLSTRRASAKKASRVSKWKAASTDTTTSTLLSANGSAVTLPWWKSTVSPATRRILDGLRRATGPPVLDAAGDDRTA